MRIAGKSRSRYRLSRLPHRTVHHQSERRRPDADQTRCGGCDRGDSVRRFTRRLRLLHGRRWLADLLRVQHAREQSRELYRRTRVRRRIPVGGCASKAADAGDRGLDGMSPSISGENLFFAKRNPNADWALVRRSRLGSAFLYPLPRRHEQLLRVRKALIAHSAARNPDHLPAYVTAFGMSPMMHSLRNRTLAARLYTLKRCRA